MTSAARRARTPRRSVAVRLGVVGAGAGAVLLAVASPASAHHVDILAAADCAGVVTWSMQSWAGAPNTPTAPQANLSSRATDAVQLSWSADGKQFTDVPGPTSLGASNDLSATGTFHLPAGPLPAQVMVRATPARFGDGLTGDPRTTPFLDLTHCQAQPTASPQPAQPQPGLGQPGASGVLAAGATGAGDRTPFVLAGAGLGAVGLWWLVRPKRRRQP